MELNDFYNYLMVIFGLAFVIFNEAAAVMRVDAAKKLFGRSPKEKYLRIVFVLAGCFFIIAGILGIFGVIKTHLR